MKVQRTFDVTEVTRRGIAAHYGEPGKASRKMIETAIDSLVAAFFDDVRYDLKRSSDD